MGVKARICKEEHVICSKVLSKHSPTENEENDGKSVVAEITCHCCVMYLAWKWYHAVPKLEECCFRVMLTLKDAHFTVRTFISETDATLEHVRRTKRPRTALASAGRIRVEAVLRFKFAPVHSLLNNAQTRCSYLKRKNLIFWWQLRKYLFFVVSNKRNAVTRQ